MKTAAYVLFLAMLCYYGVTRPQIQFDRFPYASLVAAHVSDDPAEIQRIARTGFPYKGQPSAYLSDVEANPYHLREISPIYSVKQLYVLAVYGVWRLGLSLNGAFAAVSAASVFAIGIVVFLWTRRPFLSGLLMASPPVVYLARNAIPDGLATALAIAGLFAMSRHKTFAAVLCLLVSIWVRPDMFLVAVFAFLAMHGDLDRKQIAILCAIAVASVWGIGRAGGFTWKMIMVNSFVQRLTAPLEHMPPFGLRTYLWVLLAGIRSFASSSEIAVWTLIGILAWRINEKARTLLAICLCVFAARFFIFPVPDDRFFAWMYLSCGISAIVGLSSLKPLGPAARAEETHAAAQRAE